MFIQLRLLLLLHVGQSRPVIPLHDIICLPSSHFHDIGVRDPKDVRYAYVVVPERMKAEGLRHIGMLDRLPESLRQLIGIQ